MGDPFKITPGPNGPRLGSGITVTPYYYNTAPDFPVSNPSLQWYVSAENTPTGITNTLTVTGPMGGSTQPFKNTTIPTTGLSWIRATSINGNVNVNSYTSLYGKTIKYLALPQKCDWNTSSFSYNYSDIVSNGGYTFWLVRIPDPGSTASWHRLIWYLGTSTSEFGNIIYFNYDRTDGVTASNNELRYGNATTSSGAMSWSGYTPIMNPSNIEFVIISFSGTHGTTTHTGYYTQQTYNRSNENLITSNQNISTTGGTGTWTLQNTLNAKPIFNDGTYGAAGQNNPQLLLESGFANRPYNSSEVTSLLNFIKSKYIGP